MLFFCNHHKATNAVQLNVLNPEYLFHILNSELFEAIQINASFLVLSSLKRYSTAGPGSAF